MAGGPYYIPRDVKGEGKILFVFSRKALIYTAISAGIGWVFYFIFSMLKMNAVGFVIMGLFAGIGFIIGTFKMPDVKGLEIARKTGGENIDDVIVRLFKFKRAGKKIYVNTKEEN